MLTEEERAALRQELKDGGIVGDHQRETIIDILEPRLTTAAPVVTGWKMVPRTPTKEMLDAGEYTASEWLNDDAPVGQGMYRPPVEAVHQAMYDASEPPTIVLRNDSNCITIVGAAPAQAVTREQMARACCKAVCSEPECVTMPCELNATDYPGSVFLLQADAILALLGHTSDQKEGA